jgi:hypothetical protein
MPQNFFEPRTPVAPRGEPPRAAPPAPTPPPLPPKEPSWLRIYWNTLRSFTRRRLGLAPIAPRESGPRDGEPGPGRPRRRIVLPVAVTVAVAVVATTVVLMNSGDGDADHGKVSASATPKPGAAVPPVTAAPTAPPTTAQTTLPEAPEPSPEVRRQIALWVSSHIGAGHVVACDAAVCTELRKAGLPAAAVRQVRGSAADLLSADLAVVTGPLRTLLGAETVDRFTAGQPLAAFGPGGRPASVVSVAPAGPQSYTTALAADLAARKLSGAALLKNKRLILTPGARAALAAGRVDLRLCALLANLTRAHTVSVTGFAAPSPGADASLARTGMDIASVDTYLATGPSAQAGALRKLIVGQRAPYRPLHVVSVKRTPRTNPVLSVFYAQPAPFTRAR